MASGSVLDQLYFRGGMRSNVAQRNQSLGAHHDSASRVMGTGPSMSANQAEKGGRRSFGAHSSTHNLLTGNYGADPETKLEANFKPYAKYNNGRPPMPPRGY